MAALLLLSLSVHANEIIAEIPNQGGGNISLTNIKCTTIKDTFIAYANHANGKSILGCWAADNDNVFIRWSDGDIMQYPSNSFTIKKNKVNRGWM